MFRITYVISACTIKVFYIALCFQSCIAIVVSTCHLLSYRWTLIADIFHFIIYYAIIYY